MRRNVEFDGTLDADGTIHVPESVRSSFGLKPGARVHVRLSSRTVERRLRSLGIGDREIDRIAAVQAAPHDQVIRCLLAEGACAGVSGRRGRR